VVILFDVARSIFQIGRTLAALVLLLSAGLPLADPPADEAAAPSPSIAPAPPAALCPGAGEVIAVLTRKRELWLCIDGAPAARFEVALGQGGLDKRQKGDRRTPLGTYELGTPRLSGRYGIFIPIVYPTREQAAQGLTGGDVGIHGPPRKLPEPEYPTTAFDWTLGCVATGTDVDIELIATFVRERKPMLVVR
jgi:murein L,D-transpeptidase YafK